MSESALEPALVIALINNMPDAALKATERQFRAVIQEAAGPIEVSFKYFFLPGFTRSEAGLSHFSKFYAPLASLWTSRVDGLIVTGTMPCASAFEDELYWPSFCQVVDWAEDQAIPSYWSCLAAHAAVKHIDGIERRRFDRKLSGIFECERAMDHALLQGAPDQWDTPHSRYNNLPAEELTSAGYRILSSLRAGGPDLFIRKRNSLAVFAQGHLEYDRETLLYEYRRDLGMFLKGESLTRPNIPEGYFDDQTVQAIQVWNEAALIGPGDVDLSFVNALFRNAKLTEGWRPMAVRFFANWLMLLLEERTSRRTWKGVRHRSDQISAGDVEWRAE
jgi:homoserine O-succinyltransferase/O-acetyltransferase